MDIKKRPEFYRKHLRGIAVAQISVDKDILLEDAMGIYLYHPEIEERIYNDSEEEIYKEEYIEHLLQELNI